MPIALLAVWMLAAAPGGEMTCAEGFGRLVGTIKTEWITPDREMKLLETFTYVDPYGIEWVAPAGAVVDGASIPKELWSVVGSPFTGEYRMAAVVHDVACDERKQPWRAVHRMFYNACRCAGVEEVKAKLMYAALFAFGPQWKLSEKRTKSFLEMSEEAADVLMESFSASGRLAGSDEGGLADFLRSAQGPREIDFEKLRRFIEQNNPELTEIEAFFALTEVTEPPNDRERSRPDEP